jgi:hypothetical protein
MIHRRRLSRCGRCHVGRGGGGLAWNGEPQYRVQQAALIWSLPIGGKAVQHLVRLCRRGDSGG